ncbi:MAG TPA: UDP-glucose 4-epimerase GalE [Kofleriaceae bacterium]|nr:UDP-glucose 4-epimerase GalE [Kofleriaceae bacterium]
MLVIGGAGYVGSHAVRALVAAGREVVVLDDLSTGHRAFVPASVSFIEARLEDAIDRALDGVDAVMHFAARSLVEESTRDPQRYFEANCGGALALARAMIARGVSKIVFSSTAAVFGEPVATPIGDDHPRRPTNPYGMTKMFVEDLLDAYRVHGLRAVSLRYFNAAGADPSGEIGEHHEPESHLIPIVLDAALGRRAGVTVFGTDYPTRDGTCLRDYVHVCDLADAHVRALAYLDGGGAPVRLNLGSGTGTTVREVIASVARVTEREVPHTDGPRRPGDPSSLVASAAGAEKILGWRPQRGSIDTIVEDAWRWHRRLRA